MPDYDKIGREVRAIFTAFPVEPETEEGKMVADLRYPGRRERALETEYPEVFRVVAAGDQFVNISVEDLPTRVTVGWGSSKREFYLTSKSGDPPPLVPTPDAVEKWGRWWWARRYDGDVEAVHVTKGMEVTSVGSDMADTVVDDGLWSGPVLERPVKP